MQQRNNHAQDNFEDTLKIAYFDPTVHGYH